MANFFQANPQSAASPRATLLTKYTTSRHNLLLVVIMSLVNLVLLLTNSNSYFLFSASLPYIIADLGMFLCGKYPVEYYADVPDMVFADTSLLVVLVAIAVIIIAVYLLCWIMSKKHGAGWLIAALVLFSIDTAAMFLFLPIDLGSLLDILFHVWVIYYLISGIVVKGKLNALPDEEPATDGVEIPFVENVSLGEQNSSEEENKTE